VIVAGRSMFANQRHPRLEFERLAVLTAQRMAARVVKIRPLARARRSTLLPFLGLVIFTQSKVNGSQATSSAEPWLRLPYPRTTGTCFPGQNRNGGICNRTAFLASSPDTFGENSEVPDSFSSSLYGGESPSGGTGYKALFDPTAVAEPFDVGRIEGE
jgi:hypothetical protein